MKVVKTFESNPFTGVMMTYRVDTKGHPQTYAIPLEKFSRFCEYIIRPRWFLLSLLFRL